MKMTNEEVIGQLESLRSHCEDFAEKEDPEDIYHYDIAALTIAIKTLKKTYQEYNPSRPNENKSK